LKLPFEFLNHHLDPAPPDSFLKLCTCSSPWVITLMLPGLLWLLLRLLLLIPDQHEVNLLLDCDPWHHTG
jgi:hypothetical protein